jgi:hypothetical protein
MMDPFMGLVSPGVTLGVPAPGFVNDNVPAHPEAGFHGLLLRRRGEGYEIVLCHADADRSQRVETAEDDTDIIALWRSIGQKVGLPLLAETADGAIVQIEPSPWAGSHNRRNGSPLTQRRPRFLARRKPGYALEPLPVLPLSHTAP